MRLKFAAVLPAFLLAVPAVLAQTESARIHRRRHPDRGPAAHHGRHGLQLPARQHRRPARRPPRRRGAARAVCDRLLPRRRDPPRRRHAGHRRARAPLDRELHDHGQQGHQDRGPREVAAQRRPLARQDLQPVDARRSRALPHRPVLLARQVRACRSTPRSRKSPATASRSRSTSSRASARRSGRSTSSATRRSATTTCSRTSSCRRRTGCPGTSRTTATRAKSSRATSRSCARTTWTAATRTWTSRRRRSRSRPRRTTSSSRST